MIILISLSSFCNAEYQINSEYQINFTPFFKRAYQPPPSQIQAVLRDVHSGGMPVGLG